MTNYQKLRILNSTSIVTPAIFNNLLNLLSLGKTSTQGIYAKPGGQSKATRLMADLNSVGNIGATGNGVKLPDAIAGMTLSVKNDGIYPMSVFPYETDRINNLEPNMHMTMSPGDHYEYNATDSTRWMHTNLRGATGMTGSVGATGYSAFTPSATGYDLGLALPYSILTGGTLTVSNEQLLVPVGNISGTTLVNPTKLTIGTGAIVTGASGATTAVAAANALYTTMAGLTGAFTFGATNFEEVNSGQGVKRCVPGLYRGTVSIITSASQTITLFGDGDYIFISDAEITFGANTIIELKNGAQASRIFWVAAGAITTGANNVLKGNFITPAAINIGATNDIEGRLISTIAATITVDGTATTVYRP